MEWTLNNLIKFIFISFVLICLFSIIMGVIDIFVKPIITTIMAFMLWFVWHNKFSKLFFYEIEKFISYKHLVSFQIAPGISLFISIILRPISFQFIYLKLSFSIIGLLITLFAVTLFFKSIEVIGISNAAFKNDYIKKNNNLIKKSIYKYIRHPLYIRCDFFYWINIF